MRSSGRKLSSIVVALALAGVAAIATASPASATPTTVKINNLQPSWAASGGGGVYSAYYGPTNGYSPVSPGSTTLIDGREAGIIKAGVDAYAPGNFDDEGLFAFKPVASWPGVMYIADLASGPLTYDVENQSGANPVWITIELEIGDPNLRSDNVVYQYVPPTNPAGWHTVNAGAATTWQAWTDQSSGIPTGPPLSLAAIATANPGAQVIRAYLRLGMGDSYGVPVPTIGWVDKVTIDSVTYDFRTMCTTTCYVNDATGSNSASGHADDPVKTIQKGIDLVSSGGTVNVAAGTYTENVLLNKPLTLTGAGAGTTKVRPALSNPICSPGSLCSGAASNVMLVEDDNVTISGFTVDGDNTSLTSGVVVGGADIDARNGIITNHALGIINGLEVHHVTVQNIYLRGIYASSGGTFNIHDNTVTNVQADGSSIALFNFGGGGSFTDNAVSGATDGIASNHSAGTTVSGNTVTGSSSGIHTDNAGDGGGTPDLIQGNTVSSCTTDGYGIWVFVPYVAPTVTENSVTGCTVGLGAFGGAPSTVTTTFTKNTVDGTGAITTSPYTSVGFDIDTTTFYWGDVDNQVTASNNFIQDFYTGLMVVENGGFTATADLNNNSITGNTEGIPNTTTATVPDLVSNWWGSATGPTNAVLNPTGTGDSIGTGVTFQPWLCSGTDTAPGTPGFQPAATLCPTVSLGADQTTTETHTGSHTVTNTVTLGVISPPGGTTVSWHTADGTATTANSDYVGVPSGSVVIPAGSTTATFNVTVNGDSTLEANESFTVVLTGASPGFSLGDASETVTILNDDPTVSIGTAVKRPREFNSGLVPVSLSVTLDMATTSTVTVPWNTVDGSAHVAGNDYTAASGTLTFAPGETSKTITVNVKGDTVLEDYESFSVQLGTPTNAALGNSSEQIQIKNDEKPSIIMNNCAQVLEGAACNFRPHLSHRYYLAVAGLANTLNSSAHAPGDYTALVNQPLTFPAGSLNWLTVPVTTNTDGAVEGTETFALRITTAGVLTSISRYAAIPPNAT